MNRLKTIRKERGLSQAKLSKLSDVNLKTLQAYEQNQKDISGARLETILKLCIALNCRMFDILEDEPTLNLLKEYQTQ